MIPVPTSVTLEVQGNTCFSNNACCIQAGNGGAVMVVTKDGRLQPGNSKKSTDPDTNQKVNDAFKALLLDRYGLEAANLVLSNLPQDQALTPEQASNLIKNASSVAQQLLPMKVRAKTKEYSTLLETCENGVCTIVEINVSTSPDRNKKTESTTNGWDRSWWDYFGGRKPVWIYSPDKGTVAPFDKKKVTSTIEQLTGDSKTAKEIAKIVQKNLEKNRPGNNQAVETTYVKNLTAQIMKEKQVPIIERYYSANDIPKPLLEKIENMPMSPINRTFLSPKHDSSRTTSEESRPSVFIFNSEKTQSTG